MKNVLWIIGAGASYHLGLPLLAQFRAFFQHLLTFEENRNDPELSITLPEATRILDEHPTHNIESLLAAGSPINEPAKGLLKRAIRRGFERRNLGRILKVFGKPGKLAAYCRLLALMGGDDVVVSFNYDNALETPLCLATRDFSVINTAELDAAQLTYLNDGRALGRWIPDDLVEVIQRKSLVYSPSDVFASNNLTVGAGAERIRLIKIHGSINWCESGGRIHVGTFPVGQTVPVIVYPEDAKPELLQPPHSEIVDAANAALEQCAVVVIIGYSFPQSDADGHPFVSKIASSVSQKTVFAIDPFPSDRLRGIIGDDGIFQMTFEDAVASGEFAVAIQQSRAS